MTTPSQKLKLPDVTQLSTNYSQQRSSSIFLNQSATKDDESKRAKFRFIARKADTSDLFIEPTQQSNIVGLSQIKEENTGDLDELTQSQKLSSMNLTFKPEAKNIFRTEMINPAKYQEHIRGPVIKDGQIVRHSIVGPPDIFERYQRLLKKTSRTSGIFEKVESFGDVSGHNNQRQSEIFHQDGGSSNSFSERVWSKAGSFVRKLNVMTDKKKDQEVRLSKQDVMNEISKIKERQNSLVQDEESRHQSSPDQLYLTKEQRTLKKFENAVSEWQKIIERVNKKVGRNESSSVMLTLEDHREKKEMAQVFDIIKTDEERYGSKVWYKTLRKYDKKEANVNSQESFLLNNREKLQTDIDERPPSALEIIRKPRLTKTPIEVRRSSVKRLGKTEKEYIESKLKLRQQIVREIKPTEDEDISELMIKGKNKLDLEAEVMLNQVNNKEVIRVPKRVFERVHNNSAPKKEEVIEKRFNKIEILRHGLSAIVK